MIEMICPFAFFTFLKRDRKYLHGALPGRTNLLALTLEV